MNLSLSVVVTKGFLERITVTLEPMSDGREVSSETKEKNKLL